MNVFPEPCHGRLKDFSRCDDRKPFFDVHVFNACFSVEHHPHHMPQRNFMVDNNHMNSEKFSFWFVSHILAVTRSGLETKKSKIKICIENVCMLACWPFAPKQNACFLQCIVHRILECNWLYILKEMTNSKIQNVLFSFYMLGSDAHDNCLINWSIAACI